MRIPFSCGGLTQTLPHRSPRCILAICKTKRKEGGEFAPDWRCNSTKSLPKSMIQVHCTTTDEDRTQVAQEPDSKDPREEVEQPKTRLDKMSGSANQVDRDCGPTKLKAREGRRGVSAPYLAVSSADRAVTKSTEEGW